MLLSSISADAKHLNAAERANVEVSRLCIVAGHRKAPGDAEGLELTMCCGRWPSQTAEGLQE